MNRKPFLIDQKVPARWRLDAAVQFGREISIGVLPSGVIPKQLLSPYTRTLRKLQIAVGAPEADYSFLEDFTALQSLNIWATPTADIDFTKMSLVSLACRAEKSLRSIAYSRTIRILHLENGSLDWLPANGALEAFSLYAPRKVLNLTELSAQKELKVLDLTSKRELDVGPLAGMQSLSEIELNSFPRIENLAAIGKLPNLRAVTLEEIGHISDSLVLDQLRGRGVKICVVGNQRWAEAYRRRNSPTRLR